MMNHIYRGVFASVVALGSVTGLLAQAPVGPSEEHKMLARDEGTWTVEMKMMTPNGEPMVMPGKEVNTMTLNGLWMMSEFESGPFQGRGQFGWDPVKKKFIGTWIDNMNPYLTVQEGTYDKEAGALVMFSKGINPETQKMEKMKSVTKFTGEDKKHFVMSRNTGGDQWEVMFEINYVREK